MSKVANRVKETTTTTETGTYNLLGPSTGFQGFVDGIGDGKTCYYCVEDGTNWEVGIGTVADASPDTLARTKILASSNGGAAFNWGAGTKNIFVTIPPQMVDVDPIPAGGRLTTSSTLPVTLVDASAITTLYYLPYKSTKIALYDGTGWRLHSIPSAGVSLALGTLTTLKNHNVWIYDNAGTLTLEFEEWTSDTAPATEPVRQDGVLLKTGALTRRLIGTFRTTSTTETQDSAAKRYVWNVNNRVERHLLARDDTNSWTYTTATFRAANNNSVDGVGRFSYVIGVEEDPVDVQVFSLTNNTSVNIDTVPGIGIDSTNTQSAELVYGRAASSTSLGAPGFGHAFYRGFPGRGYHFIQRLEYSAATGTTTWFGDGGAPTLIRTGMRGRVMA